jgi:DNA-binding NarL/FixJ family response regulator
MPVYTTISYPIILADNQALTMHGIKSLLYKNGKNDVVVVTDKHALFHSFSHPTVLAIIDYLSLRDFEASDVQMLKEKNSAIPILVITSDQNKNSILQVLECGVNGFLFKDCSEEEIISAVDKIMQGEKFYCNRVFDILMESRQSKMTDDLIPAELTPREVEIVKLIVGGQSTMLMAENLNLSPHTISTHRKNIIKKLKIKSPVELVTYAYDLGLIPGK